MNNVRADKEKKHVVTVIVPMHNSSKTIKRCINSVLSQTYKKINLLLIDDNSTDSTVKIAKSFADKYSWVQIYTNKGAGVSSARNTGILNSANGYVFFLDSDDAIEENVVENLVNNYSENSLVSCRMKTIDGKKKAVVFRCDSYKADDFIVGIMNNSIQGYACGFLFDLQLCPLFNKDIRYCEDMLFLIEYILKNKVVSVKYLDADCGYYNYIQNNDGVTHAGQNVVAKIKNISLAMDVLNYITNQKFVGLVERKRIELFAYEMSHAKKGELKVILNSFRLRGYAKLSLRYKLFAFLFRKKSLHLLWVQFRLESFLRSLL